MLMIAIRAFVIVLGITALASLINKLLANSGLRMWLLLNQQDIPLALWLASLVEHLAYGILVVLICFAVARSYWRSLFPEKINWLLLFGCFVLGLAFAMFLNHPVHSVLFEAFFGKPTFTGGAVSDTIAAGIFSGLAGYERLLTISALATVLLSPVIEELTDRGILFREAESLPFWMVALLSIVVFCLSHYAVGGLAKVLAVVPAAILFVAVRIKTGSFAYPAATHVGVNLAALLKLQVF